MKIKLVTGFRKDQEYTIDANEAHKAYYLYFNPDQRGVFNSGLAIKGSSIEKIVPDYHATMGWNPTHQLDSDDWNEINKDGVARKLMDMLQAGKEVAAIADVKDLNKPLTALLQEKHKHLLDKPKTP